VLSPLQWRTWCVLSRSEARILCCPCDACKFCHNPLGNLRLGSGIGTCTNLMDSGVTSGSERMLRIHVMANHVRSHCARGDVKSGTAKRQQRMDMPTADAFALATTGTRAGYGAHPNVGNDRGRMGRGSCCSWTPGYCHLIRRCVPPLDQTCVFAENWCCPAEG